MKLRSAKSGKRTKQRIREIYIARKYNVIKNSVLNNYLNSRVSIFIALIIMMINGSPMII